jgi:L-fucose isomerase-like protein
MNDLFETFRRIAEEHMAEIRREQAILAALKQAQAIVEAQRKEIAALKADHA